MIKPESLWAVLTGNHVRMLSKSWTLSHQSACSTGKVKISKPTPHRIVLVIPTQMLGHVNVICKNTKGKRKQKCSTAHVLIVFKFLFFEQKNIRTMILNNKTWYSLDTFKKTDY